MKTIQKIFVHPRMNQVQVVYNDSELGDQNVHFEYSKFGKLNAYIQKCKALKHQDIVSDTLRLIMIDYTYGYELTIEFEDENPQHKFRTEIIFDPSDQPLKNFIDEITEKINE